MKPITLILLLAFAIAACAPAQPVKQATLKFEPTTAVIATDASGAEFDVGQEYDTIVIRTLAKDGSREIVGLGCVAAGENLTASFETPVELLVPKPQMSGSEIEVRCVGVSGKTFTRSAKSFGEERQATSESENTEAANRPSGLGIFFAVLAESASDVATKALTGQKPRQVNPTTPRPSPLRYTSSLTVLVD